MKYTKVLKRTIYLYLFCMILFACDSKANSGQCQINVSAAQKEGYVSGTVYLYRFREWEEAGLHKTEWRYVDDWSLSKGSVSIKAGPGKYYVKLKTHSTTQQCESFVIKGSGSKSVSFDVSTIEIAAQQDKGYVSGSLYLYRFREWEEAGLQKTEWNYVDDWSLNKGTKTLHVAPDKYKVILKTYGTRQECNEFIVKGVENHRVLFNVSTINITARQDEGYVSGTLYLYRMKKWEEAGLQKTEWQYIDDWSLNKGTKAFYVAPDEYKVILKTYGTRQSSEAFRLNNTEVENLSFNVSTLEIVAEQNRGYVSGTVYLYRFKEWEEAGLHKTDWQYIDDWSLNKGTQIFRLAPDKYKVFLKTYGTRQESKSLDLSGTERHKIHFDVSTIEIAARQAKGYVSGTVYLYRERVWEEAGLLKTEWQQIDDWSLDKGTRILHVVPDRYRIRLKHSKNEYLETSSFSVWGKSVHRVDFNAPSNDYSLSTIAWSQPLQNKANKNNSEVNQYHRTIIIDDLIDASLVNSGIDPSSDLAKKAKKLGKDTLNPFKSGDDIQKDIDTIVQEIMKK